MSEPSAAASPFRMSPIMLSDHTNESSTARHRPPLGTQTREDRNRPPRALNSYRNDPHKAEESHASASVGRAADLGGGERFPSRRPTLRRGGRYERRPISGR